MRISLLCSDDCHPIMDHLQKWIEEKKETHQIELVHCKKDLTGGDVLFLVSCMEIINAKDREAYSACLVLHASDLPRGRGWSPHIWQLIEGANEITVSLLEAQDKVDSGEIWAKAKFSVPDDALWDEINKLLFDTEIELINLAIERFKEIKPYPQNKETPPTYYPRRTPLDSQIDPAKSISSQFNNIRVCDPNRFPAFFELHGKKYKLILEKIHD